MALEQEHLTKGERTRARVLEAAERVFGRRGYHSASIVEITREAGVAQGTFYVYFSSKLEVFRELVRTRAAELRKALWTAGSSAEDRIDIERRGLEAFFDWIAEHPDIFRVARQAEFIDPTLLSEWYRTFADSQAQSYARAVEEGALAPADPQVLAWAIMGLADFSAMRWIIWEGGAQMTPEVKRSVIEIALRALGAIDRSNAAG